MFIGTYTFSYRGDVVTLSFNIINNYLKTEITFRFYITIFSFSKMEVEYFPMKNQNFSILSYTININKSDTHNEIKYGSIKDLWVANLFRQISCSKVTFLLCLLPSWFYSQGFGYFRTLRDIIIAIIFVLQFGIRSAQYISIMANWRRFIALKPFYHVSVITLSQSRNCGIVFNAETAPFTSIWSFASSYIFNVVH